LSPQLDHFGFNYTIVAQIRNNGQNKRKTHIH